MVLLMFRILPHYDIITITYWKFNFRFDIRVSELVCMLNFNSKSLIEAEIMQCGLKRKHKISTIRLNKKDNKKRTSRRFSILTSDLRSSETVL